MEDPIRFDLWCECKWANVEEIAAYLSRLPLASPISNADSKQFAGRRMVLKFYGRSWSIVEAVRACPAPWLERLIVYQESYGPEKADRLHYCDVHDLNYAGVIGCHVCTGFYEK